MPRTAKPTTDADRETWMLLYKVAYLLAWRTGCDHEYAHKLAMANVARGGT